MFSNQLINTDELSLHHVKLNPLHPKYMALEIKIYTVLYMSIIFIITLLSFEWLFTLPSELLKSLPYIISAVFVLWLLTFLYIRFAFPKKGFAVREQDLHFSSGLFFQSHVCQPILRIQHIEIKRGPFERRAGLATLLVYSAGGYQHTFYIPGLLHDDAIRLRHFILEHRDLQLDESDESNESAK